VWLIYYFVCVHVYVGSILWYFGFLVLIWFILLLIFVVRTDASDCLVDCLQKRPIMCHVGR